MEFESQDFYKIYDEIGWQEYMLMLMNSPEFIKELKKIFFKKHDR